VPSKTPKKPYPEFPLFYHSTGQWAKKVRGLTLNFGTDPDEALAKWLAGQDYYRKGPTPPSDLDALTVCDLANRFLDAKKKLVEGDELSARTWRDY
jgi:hypothetical protein